MNWTELLKNIFELIVYPVLSIGGIYLTYLISVKIAEIKQKSKNEITQKYLDMLDVTVTNAVLTTTQTYVETLKKEGKFDVDAQKFAFEQTYEAIMKVLNAEAIKYITEVVGDIETYVTNKIEAQVKLTKTL